MSDWPETSESLILRVKDPQDDASWRKLVAIYRPVVFRMARGRGLQHEDAEDLAQGVFVAVSRAIDQWQPSEEGPRFRNWLARITRNAILNALTRLRPDRAAGTSSVAEVLHSIPTDGTNDDELIRALLKESRLEAIRWAANELQAEFTETTWSIFHATAIEGRPAAEVASVSGRSIGAVYAARCRVAARLKEKVEMLSELWSES